MDRHELAFLRAQMHRPRPVFVDVGANAGLYSLHAALHAGEGGRILAIEPDAAILARFVFNLRLAAVSRIASPLPRPASPSAITTARRCLQRMGTRDRGRCGLASAVP